MCRYQGHVSVVGVALRLALLLGSAVIAGHALSMTNTPGQSPSTASFTVEPSGHWPPKTPQDLTRAFRQVYKDLEDADVCRQVTPTLRFLQVIPKGQGVASANKRQEDTVTLDKDCLPDKSLQDGQKPLAVYLPGLDGYGISAMQQFDDLSKVFDVWRLTIDRDDTSSFRTVVQTVANFIQCELQPNRWGEETTDVTNDTLVASTRPVVLIGESSGGLLAAAVALYLKSHGEKHKNTSIPPDYIYDYLQGLVLVNPATCFDKTVWDRLVPLITSLKYLAPSEAAYHPDSSSFEKIDPYNGTLTPYSIIGSLILSTIIPDTEQLVRIVRLILDMPSVHVPPASWQELQNSLSAATEGFVESEYRLPPHVLEHRLDWLHAGTSVVNNRIHHLTTPLKVGETNSTWTLPILLVAGNEDKLLPSKDEVLRLKALLEEPHGEVSPSVETLIVPQRGHIVLDESVNLTEAIVYSKIDPLHRRHRDKSIKAKGNHLYDPISDWKLPSTEIMDATMQKTVEPARRFHSPVFFSTDDLGKRWRGLGKIPSPSQCDGPLLIVGNHQFAALDLRLLVAELFEQRNIFPRGLAHSMSFVGSGLAELQGRTPGLIKDDISFNPISSGEFMRFGAVEVTPRNYYRLLQSGQTVLLYPGGAKEALSKRRDYPLFWPNRVDFVRTAAKFNATILPLSSIGMADSVTVLAEPREAANLPFGIGERVRAINEGIYAQQSGAEGDEMVGMPIAFPRMAARNYFLFGKPIRLTTIHPDDKEACAKVYNEVKAEVERGLNDLRHAREKDPFKDTIQRLVYEHVLGTAPTFPVNELNKNK